MSPPARALACERFGDDPEAWFSALHPADQRHVAGALDALRVEPLEADEMRDLAGHLEALGAEVPRARGRRRREMAYLAAFGRAVCTDYSRTAWPSETLRRAWRWWRHEADAGHLYSLSHAPAGRWALGAQLGPTRDVGRRDAVRDAVRAVGALLDAMGEPDAHRVTQAVYTGADAVRVLLDATGRSSARGRHETAEALLDAADAARWARRGGHVMADGTCLYCGAEDTDDAPPCDADDDATSERARERGRFAAALEALEAVTGVPVGSLRRWHAAG